MKKIILRIIPIIMILSLLALIFYTTGVFGIQPDNPSLKFGILLLAIGYAFSAIIIFFVLLFERGNPSKSLSWMVVILLMPFIGVILYCYLGANYQEETSSFTSSSQTNKLIEKITKNAFDESCDEKEIAKTFLQKDLPLGISKNINYLLSNPLALLSTNNKLKVLNDGEETFSSILKELPKAKHHIHLEYFIWQNDPLGDQFKTILIERAKAGVQVRIIFDGVGSMSLTSKYIRELETAGIEVAAFRPLRFALMNAKSNHRNHRKIIVIDGKIGFTGGINIDNKYLAGDPKLGHWRDTHLRLEGNAVKGLQKVFLLDWQLLKEKLLSDKIYFPKAIFQNNHLVHTVASGADTEWDGIKQIYLHALYTAQKYVWLATPYLIPNGTMLNALKTAAVCGCDIRLIIPYQGDSKIVQNATLSYVSGLLSCGIKIYQYTEGFMHSKIMIVDDNIATIGSANLDTRSFDQNLEINAVFYYEEPIQDLKKNFLKSLEDSKEINWEEFKNRGVWRKGMEGACRLLAPLL